MSIRPEQVPIAASADTENERAEAVLNYLRDVSMGMSGVDGIINGNINNNGSRVWLPSLVL